MNKSHHAAALEEAKSTPQVIAPQRRKPTRRKENGTVHANGGHATSRPQRQIKPRARDGSEEGNGTLNSTEILRALMDLKKGDFSVRLPIDWEGTAGKIADTFNEVAESMEHSTEELNRISRLVGKEGRINERLATAKSTG